MRPLLLTALLVALAVPAWADGLVTIGKIQWHTDYDSALQQARQEHKPLWIHFGENPGCAGCQYFASGPLSDPAIVRLSQGFIPVFVDTLHDNATTRRFNESPGSYPVLRIHDLQGHDIAGRLDGNAVAGRLTVEQVEDQMHRGLNVFASP